MERVSTSPGLALERIRFGEYLVEREAINDGQLLDALADHWAYGGRIGDALTRKGILALEEVERLAAEYHAVQVVVVAPDDPLE
jgi:hypothetical protein